MGKRVSITRSTIVTFVTVVCSYGNPTKGVPVNECTLTNDKFYVVMLLAYSLGLWIEG